MNRTIFEGCKIYFYPGRLGKKRLELLVKLVLDNGGEVCSSGREDFVIHIVVEESCNISSEQCEDWCQKASIVGTKWLSQSLKDEKCLSACPFLITNCEHKRSAVDEDDAQRKKIMFQKRNVDQVEQEKILKAEENEVNFLI